MRRTVREGILLVSAAAAVTGTLAIPIVNSGDSKDSLPETDTSGVDWLNRQLNVASLLGPAAVSWTNCPPGGEKLAPSIKVNAVNYYDRDSTMASPDTFVEIDNVTRYTLGERVVAWCGTSVGDWAPNNVNGPPKGTLVVIPIKEGCTPPKIGEQVKCPGQPFEYDQNPAEQEKELEIEIEPSTTI